MSLTFEQALRSAGLRPRASDIKADGKLRRCPTDAKPLKRNGWFVLHEDGRGVWGDNQVAPKQALGHWHAHNATALAADPQIQARQRAAREKARCDRIDAIKSARRYWGDCKPLNLPHPYIQAKGLTPFGCSGLRIRDGLLVVPVWFGQSLISVQKISNDGTKKFHPGAPVKAGSFVIDRPRAALTCLVEGLATGLAVFQSVPHSRVIVCFDAGNMMPVAQRVKPTGSVVIVADNDHATLAKRGINPGLTAARNVAELLDCGLWWPDGIEGSDAADALKEWGERAGKRLEREILAKAKYVMEAPS